ncbi:MAG TPA: response regulator [Gemmatimonadales bacterium]|nr:response regulator [Gemmatimonadales bacterium]
MPEILLVDDDPDLRGALRRLLERSGMRVVEADSAEAAIANLVTSHPDVVVSDVMMPGRSGLELYRTLVEHSPRLEGRVIFLTGAADEPWINSRVEELGAPLIGKLEDLAVVVDAVRLALVLSPAT